MIVNMRCASRLETGNSGTVFRITIRFWASWSYSIWHVPIASSLKGPHHVQHAVTLTGAKIPKMSTCESFQSCQGFQVTVG